MSRDREESLWTRRQTLALAGAATFAASSGRSIAQTTPAADTVIGGTIRRIAFGSCAKQGKPQPIWNAVEAAEPDVFIFLGDNIYGDTRDMAQLAAHYRQLGDKPEFQRMQSRHRLLATWDDHDYGEDDAGAEYPMREQSRQIFCDFWKEPARSVRRSRDGIYTSYVFGSAPQRVQVILPDLRFNRTPLLHLDLGGRKYKERAQEWADAGIPVPGPYSRNPDLAATMLGARQWQWLEAQLQVPAEVRILASSLQVVADFPGWEGWTNFADDHQRLLELIRRHRANGLICISGDTHYGEVSRLERNAPYPLWDITSSGLTETWPVIPPNSLRVGEMIREPNFGTLDIDWSGNQPLVIAQLHDITGRVAAEQRLDIRLLQT